MIADVAHLIDLGYRVMPVKPASKEPAISGWTAPEFDGLTKDQLDVWFSDGTTFGVGILTGRGLFVIDVDDWDVWTELCIGHLWFPETPPGAIGAVRTPSGGRHFYYRIPEELTVTNANTFPDGIDVRGAGGYVVAPPTQGYSWTT